MNHFKGNFIMSGVGIGLGLISKKFFKKEIIPISNTKQILTSFSFLLLVTIGGKTLILVMNENYWIPYSAGGRKKDKNEGFIGPRPSEGKDKVENEGFIGPYSSDIIYLMHPNKWDKIQAIENWFKN